MTFLLDATRISNYEQTSRVTFLTRKLIQQEKNQYIVVSLTQRGQKLSRGRGWGQVRRGRPSPWASRKPCCPELGHPGLQGGRGSPRCWGPSQASWTAARQGPMERPGDNMLPCRGHCSGGEASPGGSPVKEAPARHLWTTGLVLSGQPLSPAP